MTALRTVFQIEFTLRSPFLFPALDAARFGADIAALRDDGGHPLVPAEQIRGVLRHTLTAMEEETGGKVSGIARLFGQPSDESPDAFQAPRRGRLIFADLVGEIWPSDRANRVAIDDDTGAAKTGALLTAELAAPYGAKVVFRGPMIFFGSREETDELATILKAASTRISAIGAMKSAGLGEVERMEFSEQTSRALLPSAKAPVADRVRFDVAISKPFVVNAVRLAENVFKSDTVIPGGAIKGAMAQMMALAGERPELDTALSGLRIGHAKPSHGPAREIPLSLVADKDGVADTLDNPSALVGPGGGLRAYRPDWKAGWKTLDRIGLGDTVPVRYQTRAHVRIEAGTQTAEETALFFSSAVVPGGETWSMTVDFSDIPEPDRARLNGWLVAGLDWIGSTGASIEITEMTADTPADLQAQASGAIAVTLETDAAMLGQSVDADAGYAAYWEALTGAKLIDYCAEDSLKGGWQGMRYRADPEAYAPFLVTKAGSVFLLQGANEKKLQALVRFGLPGPEGTDWQTCPFQPENGYGQIRADWLGVDVREG